MSSAFHGECEETDDSGGVRSREIAEAASVSYPRDIPELSLNSIHEDNYTVAALTAALEPCNQQQSVADGGDGVSFLDLEITSGGYCLEDGEQPSGDQKDALSFHDPQEPSDPAGFSLEGGEQAQSFLGTLRASEDPVQGAREQGQLCHSQQQQPSTPSDYHDLAELLDDDCCETRSRLMAPYKREAASTNKQALVPFDVTACSSLLGGSLKFSARQRAAEASWCSQKQAAALFCLKEQLLRDEAAAGRLRVRQQPNPHGESFKPMRLYALEEVEQLAIRVWGSLEAARAAKERRIEERWQRKKRCSLRPFPPPKQSSTDITCSPRTLERPVLEQPAHRAREDEWEEI